MKKILTYIFLLFFVVLFGACTREYNDSLLRSKVDGMNKDAFLERYKDPEWAIDYSLLTLDFISDSLPNYNDGKLRAWNTLAFAYYLVGEYDSAQFYVNEVSGCDIRSDNIDVERVIALLCEARILQRNSNIAESYRILYDIGNDKLLDRNRGNMLFNYAFAEYYITMLELNYHYREDLSENVLDLIDEVEENREELKCDYAQDMALNNALARTYMALSFTDDSVSVPATRNMLRYCCENLSILSDSSRFCAFQYGQILEMLAMTFWMNEASLANLDSNDVLLQELYTMLFKSDSVEVMPYAEIAGELLSVAQYQFGGLRWATYDYMHSLIVGADYALWLGDSAYVYGLLGTAVELDNACMLPPQLRLQLYDGLIKSGYSRDWNDMYKWHNDVVALGKEVQRIKHEDFIAQVELAQTQKQNQLYAWLLSAFAALVVLLAVLSVVLKRRTRLLNNETLALQEAKRKDIERIANVETCLSVMRHDIGPFVGYLQNSSLPDDLRQDVLRQLLRTFDNMKKWTNLSIPSGMAFHANDFYVSELFSEAASQVVYTDNKQINLVFEQSPLMVHADKQLIIILLRNILNNAYQHTEKGEIRVSVSPCNDNDKLVEFAIRDTGSGMSPDICDELFRVDKKIDDSNVNEKGYGSGFGLILARYIIKKHDDHTVRGCKIWAESRLGEGSVFYFRIAKGCPS